MKRDVLVIAHRGASDFLPDNTLESFDQAILEKADMLELDVRQTADGQLVLFHDWYMKRPANNSHTPAISRPVSHALFEQLQSACEERGIILATLEEILARYGNRININIELKAGGYEKKVVEMVRKYGLGGSVVLSSFFPWVIMKLKDIDSSIRTGWIVGQEQVVSANRLARAILSFVFGKVKADSAHFHYEIITPEIIHRYHSRDIPVYAWTVNDTDVMSHLIKLGVDGIITNKPGQLNSIINER
ncbi:MAG: glycerophosphodiester phosphodiesterase [candidate division Zixibacteria bacterium]|nr:glycerophosphodiester phosphodiesterase [candidate division Zixibacteria bacterium]